VNFYIDRQICCAFITDTENDNLTEMYCHTTVVNECNDDNDERTVH